MQMQATAVVLAAGEGKRMKSSQTKVLFEVAGRRLLDYSLIAAAKLGVERQVVVVSPSNKDAVATHLQSSEGLGALSFAVQQTARGTGDAVKAAIDQVESPWTLILCGDTPLVRSEDLLGLKQAVESGGAKLALLSAELEDPTGYGRILRDAEGRVLGIREHRDLDPDQLCIREVNSGIYLVQTALLRAALAALSPDNDQGEYYLTDIVSFAVEQAASDADAVVAVIGNPHTLVGVNNRIQLNEVQECMYRRIADRHRLDGVSVQNGARIDDTVTLERDVSVGPGVCLRGRTHIGADTIVDTGCVVTDSSIGSNVLLKPYSIVSESSVGDAVQVGPFAHLRPGSEIDADARIGNFVETKKTRLRKGAKANHLAYLGDGDVGEGANLGAGTIFCNYDGFSKSKTLIGKGAFIGSDSQLVAPVSVGEGSFVASGTTVVQDVPAHSLALSRAPQVNKEGYAPGLRERLKARAELKKRGHE